MSATRSVSMPVSRKRSIASSSDAPGLRKRGRNETASAEASASVTASTSSSSPSAVALSASPTKKLSKSKMASSSSTAKTPEQAAMSRTMSVRNRKLEEQLTCVICQDLLYRTVAMVPCMHSFCHACISTWVKAKTECPECRGEFQQANRNHTLDSLVEEFLVDNPKHERTDAERAAMDKRATLKLGSPIMPTTRRFIYDDEDFSEEDEEDENYERSDDEDDEQPYVPQPTRPNPVVEGAIQQFIAVAGVDEPTARQYVGGAFARGLTPLLERAMSYYYEQMNM